MNNDPKKPTEPRKFPKAAKITLWCVFAVWGVLLAALLVNSLLCVFMDHYYPTYGGYRLFAIVSDSMEPEIPTGNMIVGRVPESEGEIEVGTVITYELRQGNGIVLITHRVIQIERNDQTGEVRYTTRGDNAAGTDAYRPTFDDVVGIFTGNQCGFFGYFFGFLQSPEGAIALMIIALIIILTVLIVHFVNIITIWRNIAYEALQKSGSILHDAEDEKYGVIADVIGIVAKEPLDKKDVQRKDKKLFWFMKTGTLPKRPYSDDLDVAAAMMNAPANVEGEEGTTDGADSKEPKAEDAVTEESAAEAEKNAEKGEQEPEPNSEEKGTENSEPNPTKQGTENFEPNPTEQETESSEPNPAEKKE